MTDSGTTAYTDDARSHARRSVLVVDDEPDMVEMIAFSLEGKGYEVDTVTDGRAAVEKASTRHYDVALTDLQMPNQDGLATMEALRAVQPGLKVIIVTAYASEDRL